MKTLYTAFKGENNSSKILLDKIISDNKLYLENSFTTSVNQLEQKLSKNKYDLVISFGQASLEKDTIKIETIGRNGAEYQTKYDFTLLKQKMDNKFKTIISNDAGNYLCNNIYFNGLKYIEDNKLKTDMIFIHIPMIGNISNIEELSDIFNLMIE